MCISSLVPRPKEEEEEEDGERAWFQPSASGCNYLRFNHVLIGGRVPMMPLKSHIDCMILLSTLSNQPS